MNQLVTTTTKQQEDVTFSLEPLHDNRPVHGVRFCGQHLLGTVGFDGSLHLWALPTPEWEEGIQLDSVVGLSKRPLLQVDFSSRQALCAGADGLVYCVDVNTQEKLGVLRGHESYVNGVCAMGEDAVLTSSDDSTVRIWDLNQPNNNNARAVFELPREATSVAWSSHVPNQVFCGSLDNKIRCFDQRKPSAGPIYTLQHENTVTGLALHPITGRELVSNAHDGTMRIWDVSPFCAGETRLVKKLQHGKPSFSVDLLRACYSPNGKYISGGSGPSSQCTVCVWDSNGNPFKAFRGHTQAVIEVAFHATENKMASCGMDGKVFVGSYV